MFGGTSIRHQRASQLLEEFAFIMRKWTSTLTESRKGNEKHVNLVEVLE